MYTVLYIVQYTNMERKKNTFLRESDTRFSTSGFFLELVFPVPMSIPGDKFTAGDNDAGFDRVCTVWGVWTRQTIGSRVRLRRPEKSPFWFEVVLAAL